ncbi:hypothetical protein RP20_CCG020996, partial [Aedes albopictus]
AASKVDDSKGPVFLKEPTNRIDFSNSTGAVVECSATGNPPPEMIWIRSDGTAVGEVPGLRQILPNGNLVFPPFRAEDYRQDVHAQVYACMAKNQFGSIISRDVNVRAVVHQFYQTRLTDEFVLNGNSALLKCLIPSFISDFVYVDAWISDDGEEYHADSDDLVVHQFYKTRVIDEYVLNGNSALLKCLIPSFIADFISVTSWVSDDGTEIEMNDDTVVNQYYEAQVYDVFVIKGNTALFKCQIPSFVADHVEIVEWVTTDGQMFSLDDSFGRVRHSYVDRQFPIIPSLESQTVLVLGFKIFRKTFF